ncbi:beta-galactosidase [Christiangramia fulva]|uniref:Beta-galactosidase n=1 Tax=Christiangramia fulva TaxID=2126553 RepID=A0A2R3Z5Q8_9FLAO|nr:prolyl oligopeptidase family serine peptidase [Christiangramia fulva]AVR45600.1 beta-galactosidase [Christiangramia fulva]
MKNLFYLFLFLILPLDHTNAQTKIFPLWPEKIPGTKTASSYTEEQQLDSEGEVKSLSKVKTPTLAVFLPQQDKANGTAVIICPGGGYSHLAINKEGYKVAEWLNSLGVTAFVLKYRLPSDQIMEDKTIGPLQDAQRALRMVRRNADKWNLDPFKIGIMGFSAGGHLAAMLSTHYDQEVYKVKDSVSARPDFSILLYPVASMQNEITHKGSQESLLGKNASQKKKDEYSNELQVDENTPMAFLVHAADDGAVPVENSIRYFLALKDRNVKGELHVFQKGGHGFGMGRNLPATQWPKTLANWLRVNELIPKQIDSVCLFSYFKGNGEDGLHLAYSKNGLEWKHMNNDRSYLKPELGKERLMRDPCIIRGKDGNYHMVWTVGWTAKGIGYATSKDLIHWSEQKFIPVMEKEKNARNCWAPEINYDAKNDRYIIYWATTIDGKFPETQNSTDNGYNHRMYYTATKDFQEFTPAKLLFDPGFNIIDATIKESGNTFYMFLKDETRNPPKKNIKIATSKNITGPYTNISEPITGKYWAEGPTVIKIGDYWYVYFDKYIEKKYGAIRSKNLKDWEDVTGLVSFPNGARHGTVFKVSKVEFEKLRNIANGQF